MMSKTKDYYSKKGDGNGSKYMSTNKVYNEGFDSYHFTPRNYPTDPRPSQAMQAGIWWPVFNGWDGGL